MKGCAVDASSSWGRFRTMSEGEAPHAAVLVHAPSAVFQSPGGGEVQLVRTACHLRDLGLPVRPFVAWRDTLDGARLIHLFGMSREGLELARAAKGVGLPVVLSPICWLDPRSIVGLSTNPIRLGLDLAKWSIRRVAPSLPSWRGELLNLADAILPNSRAEARQLVSLFGARVDRIHVVPNGIEPAAIPADPSLFQELVGPDPFVLYAGRIEPRKNVLRLARALGEGGPRLVVVGDPPPRHRDYARACRQAAGPRGVWLPRVDPDDPLLASALAAARVLALPSWFETPGLIALEAAAAGCPVVVTPHGCTREYFGDHVQYAEPGSVRSIRDAIERAWSTPPSLELAEIVRERYVWARIARTTAEVYDQVAP